MKEERNLHCQKYKQSQSNKVSLSRTKVLSKYPNSRNSRLESIKILEKPTSINSNNLETKE